MRADPVTLGEFIDRGGSYFLSKKQGVQRIVLFEDPIVSLTRGHILREKPPPSRYQPRRSDVTSLEDAQELHLTDFAKIATGFEDYIFPPTLNRSALVTLLVDSTSGGMMRAVVTCLLATGILPKAPTIPPDWEQEGLSCAAFDIRNTDGTADESNLAPTIAPAVTRKGKKRMLHHPPTPQESRQPPSTAPPGTMPPPTPVAPSPRTRTRKQRDQGTPETMFPPQETATSAETALNQGEHQGPYPTMVQRIADQLRKPHELMNQQRGDSHLFKTEEPGGDMQPSPAPSYPASWHSSTPSMATPE